jgi:signal peptidase II
MQPTEGCPQPPVPPASKREALRLAVPPGRLRLFAWIALVGAGLDLITKEAIFRWRGLPRPGHIWWLVEGRLGIETSVNPGALFGMGPGLWWLFALLSVVALTGIVYWLVVAGAARDLWLTVTVGLIAGGILGNLYDRLGLWNHGALPPELRHGVRDWILFVWPEVPLKIFNPWPNFNVADSLLVCGAVLLVLHSMLHREPEPGTAGEAAPSASRQGHAP